MGSRWVIYCFFNSIGQQIERFQADLDYMDENADKLARQKMRSDAMKRQFAINGAFKP